MSERPKSRRGCAAIGCFSLLAAIGLLVTTVALFRPLWQVVAARWWRPTPCTIVSSNMVVNSDNRVSGLMISYEYDAGEQHFSSSRYSFSGYSAALSESTVRRVVDLLPARGRPPGAEHRDRGVPRPEGGPRGGIALVQRPLRRNQTRLEPGHELLALAGAHPPD